VFLLLTGCPVAPEHLPTSREAAVSGCSVSEEGRHAMRINMEAVPNAPAPDAATAAQLSTSRQASTIPTAEGQDMPTHQGAEGGGVWMYPSEQQFYNAMRRKV